MLTSKEIKNKSERSYKDFLQSVLQRTMFFPFHIKGNKGNANLPLQDLYPALKHLIDNSKEKLGYGYSVTYKEVNTRHSGIITMPDAVFFENPTDFLKFIGKEQAFLAFRKSVDLTKKQVPSLLKWLENNVLKCQKYADDWADILKIVLYFIHCHCEERSNLPNCYWRQLPVDVDLSAMETHQALIGELLEAVLPPHAINQNETAFEPRFGLLYDEPIVRIRFLYDVELPLSIKPDFAMPISTLANYFVDTKEQPLQNDDEILNLVVVSRAVHSCKDNCEKIFFITDKNVFLSFPTAPLSIAVFFEHSADIFSKIQWFQNKIVYFIGDITPKGFEQLSDMRAVFSNLKSFMMNKTTFDAFPQHHQTQKTVSVHSFLAHLTADEQAFYAFLISLKEKNGLLQKDVSHAFLENVVGKFISRN
jgi:hypothetical protein